MVHKHDATRGETRAYVYSDFLSNKHNRLGLSHNLYSDYSGGKYKTLALQHDSLTPWSEQRIKATLNAERWHQITESLTQFAFIASFVAMFAIAYLT